MSSRTISNVDYRFGFNGKEADRDEEWGSGVAYDYGFRIYDPSIARFLSVDPLTSSYPWYTPFQFAGNKPIWAIDVDGLEELPIIILDVEDLPKLDNIKFDELIFASPIQVYRGDGKNASYQYKSFTNSGELAKKTTEVQDWAINKAKAGNGYDNWLANRFFEHWIKGGGVSYKLNDEEIAELKPYRYNLSGSRFPKTQGAKNDVSFNDRGSNLNKKPRQKLKDKLSKMKIGKAENYSTTISAGAQTNGTLGQFAVDIEGKLTKTSETSYFFEGTAIYIDDYDFDIRFFDLDGLRSAIGNNKVRQVKLFQKITGNGTDFSVTSESIKIDDNGRIPK